MEIIFLYSLDEFQVTYSDAQSKGMQVFVFLANLLQSLLFIYYFLHLHLSVRCNNSI